jgi:hypothetical protein
MPSSAARTRDAKRHAPAPVTSQPPETRERTIPHAADATTARRAPRFTPSAPMHVPLREPSRAELAAKRAVDIVGALVGLAICTPLVVLLGIAIWLESPGSVIFAHYRLGLGGARSAASSCARCSRTPR